VKTSWATRLMMIGGIIGALLILGGFVLVVIPSLVEQHNEAHNLPPMTMDDYLNLIPTSVSVIVILVVIVVFILLS